MNPRIAKEIRVLLPPFVLTLAAAAMVVIMGPQRHETPEIWMGLLFVLGCLLMGTEAFGNEFSQKTVSLLLSQPIPRTSIWREKMQVLALGLALAAGILSVAILLFHRRAFAEADVPWKACALFALGVLCTAPHWTLLFQSTLAGMLFTVVAPTFLLGMNSLMHAHWLEHGTHSVFNGWFALNHSLHHKWVQDPGAEESSVITLLVVYCAACGWLAYNKFKKLQVADGPSTFASRELALPPRIEGVLLKPLKLIATGFGGPFGALIKKELHLQQVTFLTAALFSFLVVAWTVLYPWHRGRDWIGGLLVCGFCFYLPILPLIAGAIAVAEEKTWRVIDWQLTLPPAAREQWSAKTLVTLGCSLLLGVALPVSLVLAGGVIVEKQSSASLPVLSALRSFVNTFLGGGGSALASLPVTSAFLVCVVLYQMLLTSIAIYAGSMVRNTARALMLAVGLIVGTGFLIHFFTVLTFDPRDLAFRIVSAVPQLLVRSQMVLVILFAMALTVPLCITQYFAYQCYRTRGMNFRLLKLQAPVLLLLVWLLSLVFMAFRAVIRIGP